MIKKNIIIKIQMPLAGDMTKLLIYDKTKKYIGHLPITEDVLDLMNGRIKAFFYADYVDGEFVINRPAPIQYW